MIYRQNSFGNNFQKKDVGNYDSQVGLGQLNFQYNQYHGDLGQQMDPDIDIDQGKRLLFDDWFWSMCF